MQGLNWLANIVGKVKCFDANTVARKKLVYAKALIEITPDKPLPSNLRVRLAEGYEVTVDVSYSWKLDICSSCHSFGHLAEACEVRSVDIVEPLIEKTPLPRPVLIWIPKLWLTVPSDLPISFATLMDAPIVVTEVVPSEVAVGEDGLPSTNISWSAPENVWVHASLGMHFNPRGAYYMYVGGQGEMRRLYYNKFGDDLAISENGKQGEANRIVLADLSWDRCFNYCSDSDGYDPALGLGFLDVCHDTGSDSSDDGSGSSSSEEE